jgi:FkbM family methyltransferase
MTPLSLCALLVSWLVVAVLTLQLHAHLGVFKERTLRRLEDVPTMRCTINQVLHPAFIFPQMYRCAVERPPPHEEHQSQSREDVWLFEKIFSNNDSLSKGTFVEIGALDGRTFCNTWYFEQKWDWRGVLIEGLPSNQVKLKATQRPNVALFTTGICHANPGTLTFTDGGGAVGGTKEFSNVEFLQQWHGHAKAANVEAACVPLQLILQVTGLLDVDLFSLDVEGAELAVLETIDWSITNIHVLLVELDNGNPARDQNIRALLLARGFRSAIDTHGSIREACVPGADCTMNEVFINPNYHERKRAAFQRFQFGTGLPCPQRH